MPLPPSASREAERLAALQQLALLDTEPEEAFDALTRLASALLGVPIAAVSLVDAQRQWFKSSVGLAVRETPRDVAFCTHAIEGDGPLVVTDARRDARFAGNPLVTGDPGIRAYAGVPLRTAGGHAIGTLCAIDREPREFSTREIALLQDLAGVVQREIRQRDLAQQARRLAGDSLQTVLDTERRYGTIVDHAPVGIAVVGLDGRWLRMNPALCRILRRTPEALSALTFQDVTHPEDLGADLTYVQAVLAGRIDRYSLDKRYLRPDGGIVWGHLTVTLMRDPEGRPLHFVSIVDDITERRSAETALKALHHDLEHRVGERTAELQRVNERLAQAHARFEDLYQNAPCGYYSLDADGRFVQINETSLRLFGSTREAMIGRLRPSHFFTDAGRQRFGEVYPRFIRDGRFGPEEFDLLSGDGQRRRVSVVATALTDADGRFLRSRTVIYDVTELHATREALARANREQQTMLDNELFGIIRVRERRIVWANTAFERLFGWGPDELVGQSTRVLYLDDEAFERVGATAYGHMAEGRSYRAQAEMVRRDGRRLWIDLSGGPLGPDESLWMMLDITAMKQQQRSVEAMAYRDALTGLPNRAELMRRLSEFVGEGGGGLALGFGDLDGFKAVNDVHGHEAGDAVLREVAQRLAASMRSHDFVARLGGDEFVVVLTQLCSRAQAAAVLERAAARVADPIVLPGGAVVQVGISFGVAHGEDAVDGAALLARADGAMYASKRRAKAAPPAG